MDGTEDFIKGFNSFPGKDGRKPLYSSVFFVRKCWDNPDSLPPSSFSS
jgi:hypothetical protein